MTMAESGRGRAAVCPRNGCSLNALWRLKLSLAARGGTRMFGRKGTLSREETPYLKGMKCRLQFNRNLASSLLKWLNSLYRPALPSGNRASPVPPRSEESDGASPSGKAVDFDSTIRRFESSRPSQPVRRLETLPPDLLERPANCGVLRFNGRSPGTALGHFRLGLADSLRRILEIKYSRFWESAAGDRGRSALRGRACSATRPAGSRRRRDFLWM